MSEEALREGGIDGAMERATKVLYIAGWGRSGSTILGRILGQVEDFCPVGELRYIWDRGLVQNRLCSCGVPFWECPMWREVVAQTFEAEGEIGVDGIRRLIGLRESGLRTRHVLLAPNRKSLRAKVARMEEYTRTLERLYRAIRNVSRDRIIIDTSKFPSYGYVLQNTPGIEVYVLHLVRDPRAVAYSWEARMKPNMIRSGEPNSFMQPHSFIGSSTSWNEWNLAMERIRRYEPERFMRLRYEDFVQDPRGSTQDILRFLGEEAAENPFESEREISLGMHHTFSGNPDRFQEGTTTIRLEESWKSKMSLARQIMVTALTWPGMVRYGHSLLPRR